MIKTINWKAFLKPSMWWILIMLLFSLPFVILGFIFGYIHSVMSYGYTVYQSEERRYKA